MTTGTAVSPTKLRAAARMWGLMASYENVSKETVWAEAPALIRVLSILSRRPVESAGDIEALILEKKSRRLRQVLPPVIVGRADKPIRIPLILPAHEHPGKVVWWIRSEAGDGPPCPVEIALPRESRERRAGASVFRQFDLRMEARMEPGYYRLRLTLDGKDAAESLLVVSRPLSPPEEKVWGLFSPLYAFRRKGDWGLGDLGHLKDVQKYVFENEGRWTGVLPLLAKKAGPREDVSPYAPVSRLFWNELFLDVDELIAASSSPAVRTLADDPQVQAERRALAESVEVDYERSYRLKEKFLRALCEEFFASGDNRAEMEKFTARFPHVESYASFMAETGRNSARYHLYAQFQLERQLAAAKSARGGLYLDLPLGTAADGFDSRLYPDLFVADLSVGAPPDSFFKDGQNWGFAPVHPEAQRRREYRYFRDILAKHLPHASALRIDHVMGLHRLFVIPRGKSGKSGVYLRYPARELFAVLCLEAAAHGAVVIGEDLGTVPKAVRSSMRDWGVLGMWVLQLEVLETEKDRLKNLSPARVASLNTHDMIPFAGFLKSRDIATWRRLGWIDRHEETRLRAQRRRHILEIHDEIHVEIRNDVGREPNDASAADVLLAVAGENAAALIVNLEDLWHEENPQNLPATGPETANWRRRHARTMEQWTSDPELKKFFRRLRERLRS